ncbi:MAG TPA: methionine biosynthesis protein MetW [Miltoncostaeaceae bacterium]|nr:methionine biosynthesis protein MetW [Miltoncostaeaceae bacterium]
MRPDLQVVAALVPEGARVLDLACGEGELLGELARARGCRVQGVERDPEAFHACVARGLPVVQADIDDGLPEFDDDGFDLVVLSQALQATRRPVRVLREMMRVAPAGIVSFPNFGHWRLRAGLLLRGTMPVSRTLPHPWFATPNIHLCTLRDFERLAAAEGLRVSARRLLDDDGRMAPERAERRPNLLAAGAAYLLTR